MLGRNFGISKPNFELLSIEEYVTKNEEGFFMFRGELEESYEGDIYCVLRKKDAIAIGGSLLGSEDGEIKGNIEKDDLSADYLDGACEFGNQFVGVLDNGIRGKLPKPVHTKLTLSTPLDKDNVKDVLGDFSDCACMHFSSLLLIKGFETGKFSIFIPIDVAEDFYGEEVFEKGTNVLIIDDKPADIKTFRKYLADTEFKVIPANDINDAYNLLHKEKIHLIIIDFNMTETSGLEICQKIKKTPFTKGIPLIMTSAKPTQADVVASIEAGARDFLVKPFHKDAIYKKIEKYKAKKKKQTSLF